MKARKCPLSLTGLMRTWGLFPQGFLCLDEVGQFAAQDFAVCTRTFISGVRFVQAVWLLFVFRGSLVCIFKLCKCLRVIITVSVVGVVVWCFFPYKLRIARYWLKYITVFSKYSLT